MTEIRKKKWSRLCSEMIEAYQYAHTVVIRVDPDGNGTMVSSGEPLLSMSLERRKGKITIFQAKLGQIRNGSPSVILVMLGAPVKIEHVSLCDSEIEVIKIYNEDGYKLVICIFNRTVTESYNSFITKMASSLAKTRGFAPGHEKQDWLLAEKLVRKLVA
jgi:hypothetical protein